MAYVIMGLGNPGGEYAKTRHNAGRMAVEKFAELHGLSFVERKAAKALVAEGEVDGQKVILVIPNVYMNESGRAAPSFVKSKAAAKKLLVIRDELDLPLGTLKMTGYGRGSGGHKGIESIMQALKTKDFAQVKLGISPAKKIAAGEKVNKHVLGKFAPLEEAAVSAMLTKTVGVIESFVSEGFDAACMKANTK